MESIVQTVFKRYADITQEMKKLEEEQAILKDHIIGYMNEKDTALVETDFGKFKINERINWKYGETVDAKNEELKEAKKKEEEDGVAQSSTLRFLTFKA